MKDRQKKLERSEDEAKELELAIGRRKEGTLKKIKEKNGEIVIGLCAGYKPKRNSHGHDYFRAIVKYLKENLAYENFSICLFPNQFNPSGVDDYLEKIRDLLKDPFLQGKVFALGGLDRVGIKLPNYVQMNEENWNHAAEAFAALQKQDPEIDRLLDLAVGDYLSRNTGIDPVEARKVKIDEVTYCIANMIREGESFKPRILLDSDENLPEIMTYVMTKEMPAKILQRMAGSLSHLNLVVGPKAVASAPVQVSPPHNDNCFNRRPADEADAENFLTKLAYGLLAKGADPVKTGELVVGGYLKLKNQSPPKSPPEESHQATMSSTRMMQGVFSREKTVHTPPGHSPEYLPQSKRHEVGLQPDGAVIESKPVTSRSIGSSVTTSGMGFLSSNREHPENMQDTPSPMEGVSKQVVVRVN